MVNSNKHKKNVYLSSQPSSYSSTESGNTQKLIKRKLCHIERFPAVSELAIADDWKHWEYEMKKKLEETRRQMQEYI
jgi:hypothetical protein